MVTLTTDYQNLISSSWILSRCLSHISRNHFKVFLRYHIYRNGQMNKCEVKDLYLNTVYFSLPCVLDGASLGLSKA